MDRLISLLVLVIFLCPYPIQFAYRVVGNGNCPVAALIFKDIAAESEGEDNKEKNQEESEEDFYSVAPINPGLIAPPLRSKIFPHPYDYSHPFKEIGNPPPERLC